MARSKVAAIRRQIELEYEAARRALTDFTPMAQHEYINQRQERIAFCFRELTQYMSSEEAMAFVFDTEDRTNGEEDAPL